MHWVRGPSWSMSHMDFCEKKGGLICSLEETPNSPLLKIMKELVMGWTVKWGKWPHRNKKWSNLVFKIKTVCVDQVVKPLAVSRQKLLVSTKRQTNCLIVVCLGETGQVMKALLDGDQCGVGWKYEKNIQRHILLPNANKRPNRWWSDMVLFGSQK